MRLGLRFTLLSALLLVSAGGIVSVGFISVWRTRAAMADDRYERVASEAELAGRVVAILDRERLDEEGERLRRSLGARELAVLDAEGRLQWPPGGASLPTDPAGVASAHAGMQPTPRTAPGSEPGDEVVLYAAAGPGQVVRLLVPISGAVDELLARARTSVIILGIIDGLVLLGAAAWLLRAAVVRPVRELEQAALRVTAGDLAASPQVRGVGELARLADAFDAMTRSLREGRDTVIRQEKLAGVGRLAAGVAHEVGNPLAAILGYTEMLLGDTPERPISPELRADVLTRVRNETQRIHRIIQELLDYSRPPREAKEPVDLARVVDQAVHLVRAQSRFKSLDLAVDLPASLPRVLGDTGRLTQVVLNLVLNAGDATQGEGRVSVSARAEPGQVVLAVADDGPGVPPEVRGKIFDPFFTTKDPGAGTGLGLSVSQAIVEGMGGTVRLAESTKGARFEVVLPLA